MDLLTFIGAWGLIGLSIAMVWGAINWFRPQRRELSKEEWEAWGQSVADYEDIPEEEIV